ncbi:MAG: RHS repeat domain-containing protein, partial [Anaerolineae bacterium]
MSDTSGITSWVYDARGRLVQESKYVNGTGGGTFMTQWSYDSADRMTSLTYPDGEVVNYTYAAQGLVKTAIGKNTYVGDTAYNVLGQVELRRLG